MMTMSTPLSAGQATQYHREQFRDAREHYYSEGHEIRGQWDGRLAAAWGLVGEVSETHFARLAEGQHPVTGAPLVKGQTPHTQTSAQGATVRTVEHRAGWDLTLSAPKSVSLTALVGGDARVRDAHRQAVETALRATEPYVQARMGGSRPAQTTGQWIAARFDHEVARPVDGYAAPQLHTHTVVFNLTTTAAGQTRSLQPRELYRTQQYATAVYRSALATQLTALGYAIERGGSGQPEIRGYTPAYLAASSPRRQQIEAYLEQTGHHGAAAAQIAAHQTREAKGQTSPAAMRRLQRTVAATFGDQPAQVVAAAYHCASARRAAEHAADPTATATAATARRHAVTFARARNIERNAVPHERDYLRDALSRSMGEATVAEIRDEFARQIRGGQFVEVPQPEGRPGRAFTTPEMIALETQVIATMRAGRDSQPALIREDTRAGIAHDYPQLASDQRAAIAQLFANRDRVQALDGVAGAGKTTVLAAVRDAAQRDGYTIEGMAPTGRAAHLLAEAGMPTRTLQRHLLQPPGPTDARRLYVLDESSLASTTQLHAFLTRLGPHDRVLLVGDARQHEAVDAGRPYAQLQEAGVALAHLDAIKRQQDPGLRHVVELLARGEVRAALTELEGHGRVHEIIDRHARLDTVAQAYVAHPQGTLVVSPDNQSRDDLNAGIHRARQAAGQVARDEHDVRVLVPRQDLTGPDRAWAGRYVSGEVVRYARGSAAHGLEAGAYARVIGADVGANTVTVRRDDGTAVRYDPRRLQGVSVYREAARAFAVGDRVQFTAPLPAQHVANRELGTITAGDAHHGLRVRLDSGRAVTVRLDAPAHLDHGYAVTSHSSQGQTADRVLLYLDSARGGEPLVNQRLAYVALSRGRHDAAIYTDDRARLAYTLSRDGSHASAIDPGRNPEAFGLPSTGARQQAAPRSPDSHQLVLRAATGTRAVPMAHDTVPSPSRSIGEPGVATHAAIDRTVSDDELRTARAYLARPDARAYLRDRHNHGPSRGLPAAPPAPAIDARHVAVVLRRLPADARGSSLDPGRGIDQTPAVILRAAEAVARAEQATGVAPPIGGRTAAAEHAYDASGHTVGHSHS